MRKIKHVLFIVFLIAFNLDDAKKCSGADVLNKAKPSIVLVFIDDMGWADFSCFGNTVRKKGRKVLFLAGNNCPNDLSNPRYWNEKQTNANKT